MSHTTGEWYTICNLTKDTVSVVSTMIVSPPEFIWEEYDAYIDDDVKAKFSVIWISLSNTFNIHAVG